MLKLNFSGFCLSGASLILVFTLMSCGKPLTNKEEDFFNELETACNCEVSREYDEDATSDFKYGPGWYKLILTYDHKINPDSLEMMSMKIAYELHESVLTDVEYPYNVINVSYIFDNSQEPGLMDDYAYPYNNHARFYPY